MIIIRKRKFIKKIIYIIIASCVIAIIFYFGTNNKNTKMVSSSVENNSYEILVDVEESKLYLFQNKEVIKIYPCSGGKWSTPSPIGTWQIVEKATWGEGFRRTMDGT